MGVGSGPAVLNDGTEFKPERQPSRCWCRAFQVVRGRARGRYRRHTVAELTVVHAVVLGVGEDSGGPCGAMPSDVLLERVVHCRSNRRSARFSGLMAAHAVIEPRAHGP